MGKKKLIALLSILLTSAVIAGQYYNAPYSYYNQSASRKATRYDYIYMNPPRQSLDVWGRYIYSNSSVRYVNSPSKLKRAAHAARINAYNYEYENY